MEFWVHRTGNLQSGGSGLFPVKKLVWLKVSGQLNKQDWKHVIHAEYGQASFSNSELLVKYLI